MLILIGVRFIIILHEECEKTTMFLLIKHEFVRILSTTPAAALMIQQQHFFSQTYKTFPQLNDLATPRPGGGNKAICCCNSYHIKNCLFEFPASFGLVRTRVVEEFKMPKNGSY